MEPLEGIPEKILGLSVKTRWQISLNYLIPCVVELLIYISVMVIDVAVIYQHLNDRHFMYAGITLGVILVPSVLTFICVMLSDQWPIEFGCGSQKAKFFARQVTNLILFPFCAVYRFSRKIFWCVEALFHEKNTYERHQTMTKAAENSPFELYHFLQSFFHSAPQVILQLFILLRDDWFRNYETAFVQSLSVVFALIKMAMTVESYQRFESQKLVGFRNYPWLAPHQVHMKTSTMRRTLSAPDVFVRQVSGLDPKTEYLKFCKSINVEENNLDEKKEKTVKEIKFIGNITNDTAANQVPANETDSGQASNSRVTTPEDDLMDNIQEIKEYLQQTCDDDSLNSDSPVLRRKNVDEHFDRVPSLPPPPRPTSTKHPYLDKLHRISTFKDMLVFNAESFIKEKVPRIPEGMFEHHPHEKEIKTDVSAKTFNDEADILLPTRKILVDGIENDDLIAKFISFLGWVMFLLMRMISLSVFAVFYPEICGWICLSHYLFMFLCLILETRFKEKWQRTGFYFILSYIYIFNIMEFKIKFKNVRQWYIGYFLLVISQNIAMTVVWYKFTLFLSSWWFEFFFLVIVQSGITSVMCFGLYFFYLKPKDKVLFVNK